ncbi:hypothetical protein A0H81_01984 [Grifola frondosa]|uniref:RING-type domain-containing protein n=1 Tax=Grifola frondosa TaxID=5627 RepID=A0A1C7MNZ8_GRIFR|nr:hypothetical protein A0H81_01984 [Grifola frondosa]
MLVVHPSSTCDVCLEPYNWTTPRNAPHAIQCGHIFCQQCLENLHPSVCPLCRKSFGSVKKLHVDRLTDVQHGSTVEEDEADLLHRIALHFADGTEVDRAEAIIRYVYEWMAVHPENLSASRTLRTATTALHNYKSLQQKSEGYQRDIRQISENYMNLERNAKADRDRTKKVEEGLLVKVEELEAQIEAYGLCVVFNRSVSDTELSSGFN